MKFEKITSNHSQIINGKGSIQKDQTNSNFLLEGHNSH
jgi:hypothetical protein